MYKCDIGHCWIKVKVIAWLKISPLYLLYVINTGRKEAKIEYVCMCVCSFDTEIKKILLGLLLDILSAHITLLGYIKILYKSYKFLVGIFHPGIFWTYLGFVFWACI